MKPLVNAKLQRRRERKVALLVGAGRHEEAAKWAKEWGIELPGGAVSSSAPQLKVAMIDPPAIFSQKTTSNSATSVTAATTDSAGTTTILVNFAKNGQETEGTAETGTSATSRPDLEAVVAENATVTTSEPRLAKIYCCPNNKRMRLIEFQDDRSHGHLFVQQSAPPMLNWVVWVKPDGGGHWILQGSYNSRGVRVR